MKEAANHMESVADVTLNLGKGIRKSVKNYSKEAGR